MLTITHLSDKEGLTHEYATPALRFCRSDGPADEFRFILNGLRNANKVLGEPAFVENDWKVIGEYVYDAEGGRHQAFYAPKRDTIVMGQRIRSHERIHVEQSLKYSKAEAGELWKRAGMDEIRQWRHREEYGMWLYIPFCPRDPGYSPISRPQHPFSNTPRFVQRGASQTAAPCK